MNEETRDALVAQLRAREAMLLREVGVAEEDLRTMQESRPAELEEEAQTERLSQLVSQLDERERQELSDIRAALHRVAAGTYGICEAGGEPIPIERLRAVPAATLCVEHAAARERSPRRVEELRARTPSPPDLALLSDDEIQSEIYQHLRDDGRIDLAGLHVSVRRGTVHLEGTLPSAPEHQILLKVITDVLGLEDVVDRVQVNPWEREDVGPSPRARLAPGAEPAGEGNVVESVEEGTPYEPPDAPLPDEE